MLAERSLKMPDSDEGDSLAPDAFPEEGPALEGVCMPSDGMLFLNGDTIFEGDCSKGMFKASHVAVHDLGYFDSLQYS